MVLFIMFHKLVLTFNSMDETLVCENSNESYREALSSVSFATVNETLMYDHLCEIYRVALKVAEHSFEVPMPNSP